MTKKVIIKIPSLRQWFSLAFPSANNESNRILKYFNQIPECETLTTYLITYFDKYFYLNSTLQCTNQTSHYNWRVWNTKKKQLKLQISKNISMKTNLWRNFTIFAKNTKSWSINTMFSMWNTQQIHFKSTRYNSCHYFKILILKLGHFVLTWIYPLKLNFSFKPTRWIEFEILNFYCALHSRLTQSIKFQSSFD